MTKRLEVYKCDICGNIVMVLHEGPGALVCCGEPMKLLEEQSAEMKLEKHVPVVEKDDGTVEITVGSTLHPMEEKHYIEWIEAQTEDKTYIKFLKPGDEPKADFKIDEKVVKAREFCNIHGLWKT